MSPPAPDGAKPDRAEDATGTVLVILVAMLALVVGGALVTGGDGSATDVAAGALPTTEVAETTGTTAPGGEHSGGGHGAGVAADQAEVPAQVDRDAVPVRSERVERKTPRVVDGVKVFYLTAEEVQWEFVPGVPVTAWGYDGQVPGPEIWVDQGDRVRIEFTNLLPVPTTVHWHGVAVPIGMDGVPGVSQDPVEPGGSFVYEFTAEPEGTMWYHSHFDSARQVDMGLAGVMVIKGADEATYDKEFVQLVDEWIRLPDGRNGWEGVLHAGHNQSEYNWFTINGKSFPATEAMEVTQGERVRIRVANAGYQAHPMHLHGRRFLVVAKDGAPLPAPYEADTVLVGSGERYDLEIVADDVGDWMFHCHILHHVGNDTVEPGGLMTFLSVKAA